MLTCRFWLWRLDQNAAYSKLHSSHKFRCNHLAWRRMWAILMWAEDQRAPSDLCIRAFITPATQANLAAMLSQTSLTVWHKEKVVILLDKTFEYKSVSSSCLMFGEETFSWSTSLFSSSCLLACGHNVPNKTQYMFYFPIKSSKCIWHFSWWCLKVCTKTHDSKTEDCTTLEGFQPQCFSPHKFLHWTVCFCTFWLVNSQFPNTVALWFGQTRVKTVFLKTCPIWSLFSSLLYTEQLQSYNIS